MESQVLSPVSIFAISAVLSMEIGTYHFTWSPKSQVPRQFVQSQLFGAWKLGLATSHGVPSLKSHLNLCNISRSEHGNWDLPLHMESQVLSPSWDAYMATLFGGEAWDILLIVGSSTKLDPTLNTSPTNIWSDFYDNRPYFDGWGSKIGTLYPCWDLLTRGGLHVNWPLVQVGWQIQIVPIVVIFLGGSMMPYCIVNIEKR